MKTKEMSAYESVLLDAQLNTAQQYVEQLRKRYKQEDVQRTELIDEFVSFCMGGK